MVTLRHQAYSRWRLTRRERRNLLKGLLFISPWLIGFAVFWSTRSITQSDELHEILRFW